METIKKTKLSNIDIDEMINGIQENTILREGLCGKDLSLWDLSDLDYEHFKLLSFDENTIFSEEQQEKFHPDQLLNSAKKPMKELQLLHSNNIDGTGIKVAIIDTNIDIESLENSHFSYIDNQYKGDIEAHGSIVLSSFIQTAPNANILYYPSNKKDTNRANHLIEYIEHAVKSGVDIISLSASLKTIINNSDELKRINELLIDNEVTLIDSDKFYENFTYCYRNIDLKSKKETMVESLCEPEDLTFEHIWRKMRVDLDNLLSEYKVDSIEELKKCLKQDGKDQELKLIQEFEPIVKYNKFSSGKDSPLHFLKQIDKDRERNQRIQQEVPCGGRTLNGRYFGTCSASYTIPVVSGIFVLCKQVNPSISYENFVDYCRETSQKIDGRYLIQPYELINKTKGYPQNITMKAIVSNAITHGIATEDIARFYNEEHREIHESQPEKE